MTKRIKVLYTIPNFDTAGSGKVVYDLLSGLNKEHFEVEIACGSNKGEFFKTVQDLGVPIYIFETKTTYRPYYSLPVRILTISKFFKANKFDIIHSWQWSSDWTEVLAARWVGVKFLYTKKAMSWGNLHWKIKSYLSSFIITINEEMTQYFSYKKNQKLIPLGLDTSYYDPDLFENCIEDDSSLRIITVANLVPVKGVEVLIEALSMFVDSNVSLTVLGDNNSEYSHYLKNYCNKLNVSDQVKFIKRQKDVRPFLASSDLFVIPTLDQGRKEGMPMALVEAMSMGLPVLGSDISGINFVLKDFDSLLFKANNAIDLKTKINKILSLSAKERHELGGQLRHYVISHFSFGTFIKEHERLYKSLIKVK